MNNSIGVRIWLFTFFIFVAGYYYNPTFGQGVAINSSGLPADTSAALDVSSSSKGLLIPRITQSQRDSISQPANGLLIYLTDGTPGFYYNAGTSSVPDWQPLKAEAAAGSGWGLTGNTGTNASTNFIGTNDANAFVIKTNGSGAANERVRISPNGQVVVNRTNFISANDVFSSFGAGSSGAINSVSGFPINGYSAGAFAGIYGENIGTGQGVLGSSNNSGIGVYGTNSNNGYGVYGFSQSGFGVNGLTSGINSSGIRGINTNFSGTGIIALGNNIATGVLAATGSGLATTGTQLGAYSVATDETNGIGLYASGNNITNIINIGGGAGIIGNGYYFGVIGYASTATLENNIWGGYFDYRNSSNGFAFVGGRSGGVDYAILSNGVKSTMVKDVNGNNRILFCPEAPEVLFEDYGTGTLVNGRARINLDPIFSDNIYSDKDRPVKVFIQLEGECNGVYVTNKSADGFDVIELSKGTSNISFSWHVVANRADSRDKNGIVQSEFAKVRFPVGPEKQQVEMARTEKSITPPDVQSEKFKQDINNER